MNLFDLTWPTIHALDRNTPVIFPIAALEQHGPAVSMDADCEMDQRPK